MSRLPIEYTGPEIGVKDKNHSWRTHYCVQRSHSCEREVFLAQDGRLSNAQPRFARRHLLEQRNGVQERLQMLAHGLAGLLRFTLHQRLKYRLVLPVGI